MKISELWASQNNYFKPGYLFQIDEKLVDTTYSADIRIVLGFVKDQGHDQIRLSDPMGRAYHRNAKHLFVSIL